MPFIPTPACARVAIEQKLFSQDVVNTLWFSWGGAGEPAEEELLALAGYVKQWWIDQMAPVLSVDISIVNVNATGQASLTEPSVDTGGASTTGELAGAAIPSSNCVTISFRTYERGRSGRGRNYVAGLREVDVVGNVVDNATITGLVDAYLDLIDNPLTPWNWCVVSHYSEGAAREEGYKQVVTSVTVADTNIDSQRRRLTGRGS